ncbi:MAG: DUF1573 domain-containing protein [Candidatus Hydrogenedentes bacterium]|nr:DUF1573 domain-containing protein [Candidatus Hydrogenedentota bacterium]
MIVVLMLQSVWLTDCRKAPLTPEERAEALKRLSTTYVFPLARQGQVVRHTFDVHNPLSEPLKIAEVSTSCGCTVAEVKPDTPIPPGKTLPVPVQLDLTAKGAEVEATVNLKLEGESEAVVLTLKGNIAQDCPTALDFADVKRGPGNAKTFEVRTFPGQPPVSISGAKYDESLMTVAFHTSEADPGIQVATVTLRDDVPFGAFNTPIEMQTNDTEVPVKRIRVKGRVLPLLALSKKSIYFGELKPDQPVEESVELTAPYGGPLEIVNVENSKPDVFAWEASATERPDEVQLRVRTTGQIHQNASGGIIKGELILHARAAGAEHSTRVELYGLVP